LRATYPGNEAEAQRKKQSDLKSLEVVVAMLGGDIYQSGFGGLGIFFFF
jgi:hypothetical protein